MAAAPKLRCKRCCTMDAGVEDGRRRAEDVASVGNGSTKG